MKLGNHQEPGRSATGEAHMGCMRVRNLICSFVFAVYEAFESAPGVDISNRSRMTVREQPYWLGAIQEPLPELMIAVPRVRM